MREAQTLTLDRDLARCGTTAARFGRATDFNGGTGGDAAPLAPPPDVPEATA